MKSLKRFFERMSPAVKRSVIVAVIIILLLLLALLFIDIWEKRHSEFEGEADDSFLFVEIDGKYYDEKMYEILASDYFRKRGFNNV